MKKKILIPAIILVVLAISAFVANWYLPDLSTYLARRFTGSHFTVSSMKWSMKGTTLLVQLQGVRFKDPSAEGTVKLCDLALDTTKWLYFDHIKLYGLDVRIFPSVSSKRSFSMPVKHLKIMQGSLTVDKDSIFINEITVDNINIGKEITFKADINGGRYFKNVIIAGQGTWKKDKEDLSGKMTLAGLDLNALEKTLKGSVKGNGTFRYKEKKLVLQAKAEAEGFELMDYWLKKPILAERPAADVTLTWADGVTDLAIRNLFRNGIPFTLDVKLDKNAFSHFELTSGFIDVMEVAAHATSDYSLKVLWDALDSGVVRAKKYAYDEKNGTTADLEFKGVGLTYRKIPFNDINGAVAIDEEKVLLKDIRGAYKTSRFTAVNGVIPYSESKPIEAKGLYNFNLTDLPDFVDLQGVKMTKGTTQGAMEVSIKGDLPPAIHGSGSLKDGEMAYKDLSFKADGSYRFSGDSEVFFDPVVVRRDKSIITCRGKWNKNTIALAVKGDIETSHLHSLASMPLQTKGLVSVEGDLGFDGKTLNVAGDVTMDELGAVVPGYLEKKQGVPSKARIRLTQTGNETEIKEIDYRLGDMTLRGYGHVAGRRITNGRVKLDVPAAGELAMLFLLPPETAHGAIALDLLIDDMSFPFRKLPRVRGFATISDGALRLPKLANPLSHIDLKANFTGPSFDIEVAKLFCGASSLKKGSLVVKGIESPEFSLLVDMDKFNAGDFFPETKKEPWQIPSIPKESILGMAGGDFALSARDVTIGSASGKNLEINGVMADRKISFSELKVNLFDGSASFQGVADLAGSIPYLYLNGRLNRMKSGLLIEALGSSSTEIVGETLIDVNLKSEGKDKTSLISGLKGNLAVYSKDGVIKKWTILSKIFSLLNLYDMLKGKINFTQSGLAYTKMGAVFTVNDGIFHTDNFLLDSPSMVITGKGDLDANKKEISGSMVVSPLIAIDRTIDKIPIIRNILKKRGQGFLYLTYDLKGPVEDPQISPSLTGTLGSKTIEILRNILVLPIEVPKEVFK